MKPNQVSSLSSSSSSSEESIGKSGGEGAPSLPENLMVGVSRYRWVVLAIFSIENMVNSIMWICFAPIQTTVREYYSVTSTVANLLTLMFLICSLPSTLVAMFLQERYGLRFMMWAGSGAQAIGGWVRFAGQGRSNFSICLAGSIIAGPSMAAFMCLPSKLSAQWFPPSERATATTIGSLTGVLGVLAGYVIGPSIISDLDDMPTFLLVQAIIPTVSCALVIFFRAAPPLPPSYTETIEKYPLKQALQVAFSNKPFVLVLIGFTFGLGCFNALSTLIDQIVNPLGYSEDDSSLYGGLLIGIGLVGAGILGFFVEKTHKYKLAMMISIWGCVFSIIWMVLALKPNNGPSLTASFSFIGFFGLTLLPLALECGCELIFPVPEVVTNGLLMVFGQTFGVVIVFIMDGMKEDDGDMTNACWLLFSFVVVSALFISSFYPAYQRITKEDISGSQTITKENISSEEIPKDTPWFRLFY